MSRWIKMLRVVSLAACSLVLVGPRAAFAGGLTVSPVRVHLSDQERSARLKLENTGESEARFQVKAYEWSQTKDGQMTLDKTKDLLFFPSLIVLPPGEVKAVRLAWVTKPGAVERSYRLFIEELPPAKKGGPAVKMLTRFGVPVFVQPAAPAPLPTLRIHVSDRTLGISLTNNGNSYLMPDAIVLRGVDSDQSVILDQELSHWYVLARSERVYSVPLPDELCSLRSVSASLLSGGVTTRVTQGVPVRDCGR